MTKPAPEWVRTSDPVIRSPARYRWTTAPPRRKSVTTSVESVGEKRQRRDREGYARVEEEEETPVGKGIFFGSSQLRELVDKSGRGLAATTLA